MWFKRFFKGRKNRPEEQPEEQAGKPERDSSINQGIFYLYLIIVLQVLFVFFIAGAITVVGQVIVTPLWVFMFAFLLIVAGGVYIYRKAKRQLRKLRETIRQVDLSNRNYEISIMGGMLTMRVEQSPQRLLEAPKPILDAESPESPAPH